MIQLTDAMAELQSAGLMDREFNYPNYWAEDDNTTCNGRFIVCSINLLALEYASTVKALSDQGIRIVYIMGITACFEFPEDIEDDA